MRVVKMAVLLATIIINISVKAAAATEEENSISLSSFSELSTGSRSSGFRAAARFSGGGHGNSEGYIIKVGKKMKPVIKPVAKSVGCYGLCMALHCHKNTPIDMLLKCAGRCSPSSKKKP